MARKSLEKAIAEEKGFRVKNNRLEYRFKYNGKTYSVNGDYSFDGFEQCRRKAEEKKKLIDSSSYIRNADITVRKYAEEWLKSRKGTVKDSTINENMVVMRSFIPIIGDMKVRDIERRVVIDLQQKLYETMSSGTVNQRIGTLRTMLNAAVADGILQSNPANYVKPLKRTEPKITESVHRALTDAELETFFRIAKAESAYYFAFKMLYFTGMRTGELAGLLWTDIDKEAGVIHIRRTASQTAEGRIVSESAKTASSERDFPLTKEILATLEGQKELCRDMFKALNPYIFPGLNGGILPSNGLLSHINKIIRIAAKYDIKLERFAPHAFRDTFATNAVRAGVPLLTVQKLLGHSSLEMLTKIYAQISKEDKIQGMGKITFAISA